MSEARRLITSIDIDEAVGAELDDDRRLSISALLELTDRRRLRLLEDRGWSTSGPSGIWSHQSVETLTETAHGGRARRTTPGALPRGGNLDAPGPPGGHRPSAGSAHGGG